MSKLKENKKWVAAVTISAVILSGVVGSAVLPVNIVEEPGFAYLRLQDWTQYTSMPYDQGFEQILLYENSTGSWVLVATLEYNTADVVYTVPANAAAKLIIYTWLNSTLVGADNSTHGQDLQRHNITISYLNGTSAYSVQGLTYDSVDTGIDPPLWLYEYYQVCNFLFDYGTYYNISIRYDTFY